MNYYDMLEVSSKASPAVIKAAYKSLMQRYHPDKNHNDSASAQRTAQLVQAYEVLSDEARRAAYDLQINAQTAHYSASLQDASRMLRRQTQLAQPRQHAAKSYWLVWLLIIATIAVALWFLLRPARTSGSGSPYSEQGLSLEDAKNKLIQPPAQRDDSASPRVEALPGDAAKNLASITNEVMLSDRQVTLLDAENLPVNTEKILKIPLLRLTGSTPDAKKLIWYADDHKVLLWQNIETKLMRAKSAQLIAPDSAKYVQEMVMQGVTDMVATHKPDLATQVYSIDIHLPKSFTVGLYNKIPPQPVPAK
jgi:curved DNA-binding protein CbpA